VTNGVIQFMVDPRVQPEPAGSRCSEAEGAQTPKGCAQWYGNDTFYDQDTPTSQAFKDWHCIHDGLGGW